MFQIEQLKSKNFIVYHKNYRFKEDWLLQAFLLGKEQAIDWIRFIEESYSDSVKIFRESYLCEVDHVYRGPAGLKLEFLNKKSAEDYCQKLNTLGV